MHDAGNVADVPSRRRAAALAGHLGQTHVLRAALADPDGGVRATALAGLQRAGTLADAELTRALGDQDAAVRRRACEVCARWQGPAPVPGPTVVTLLGLLSDPDPSVVEVAAWAVAEVGERQPLPAGAVGALAGVATAHGDALAREAAVAALGALGDPEGLAAILAGTTDKPAVRRRAVLALAAFDGPEVDAAVERAASDRDWQVREAAELLRRDGSPHDDRDGGASD